MLSGAHFRCHINVDNSSCTRPKLACSTHSRTHRRLSTQCVNGQGAHIACASASHADDSTVPSSQQQQQAQQLGSPSECLPEQSQQQEAQPQQLNTPVQPQRGREQGPLLPSVAQNSLQQTAACQQQQGKPEWGWNAWMYHCQDQDELGSQLDDACLELESAVAQEDYAAAAELKRSILSLLAQDAVAELNRSIQEALQAEDYSTVARLRNEGGAWMEGWWTCSNSNDGQLLRIAPEYGRWTARSYTAKDLAVIKGLVDEETAFELLEQSHTNQQVAAAAVATARVVTSLRGQLLQQQQPKGDEQLQRALLLLGTPELEAFVRPAGDTHDEAVHAHGNSSSSHDNSNSNSSGSTVTQSSSSDSSNLNIRDGSTGQQQQQQRYVMQGVGLGRLSDAALYKLMLVSVSDLHSRGSSPAGEGEELVTWTKVGRVGQDGQLQYVEVKLPASHPLVSDNDSDSDSDSDDDGDSDGELSDAQSGDEGDSLAAEEADNDRNRWPVVIAARGKDSMSISPEYVLDSDVRAHGLGRVIDMSFQRLSSHTSSSRSSFGRSSSSRSRSSSDPLQGYFLGPAYLDREDPQLLLLQMGRCPDSNKLMLLGTTVTGSDERPARELFMRADVSPQSDPLPVELFPSKLGVTSRHPAEVRFRDKETWDHAELLQLKQGKVRNEMTDGAQLGLLWKPEGSSKHVMVLLHRVVLEEL